MEYYICLEQIEINLFIPNMTSYCHIREYILNIFNQKTPPIDPEKDEIHYADKMFVIGMYFKKILNDEQNAQNYFAVGYEYGNIDAFAYLFVSKINENNVEEVLTLLRDFEQKDEKESCRSYYFYYTKLSIDKEKSIEYLNKGINLGCTYCMLIAGDMYQNIKNYSKAIHFWTMAAENGKPDGYIRLGDYFLKVGILRNAEKYYIKAVENNKMYSIKLAELYLKMNDDRWINLAIKSSEMNIFHGNVLLVEHYIKTGKLERALYYAEKNYNKDRIIVLCNVLTCALYAERLDAIKQEYLDEIEAANLLETDYFLAVYYFNTDDLEKAEHFTFKRYEEDKTAAKLLVVISLTKKDFEKANYYLEYTDKSDLPKTLVKYVPDMKTPEERKQLSQLIKNCR